MRRATYWGNRWRRNEEASALVEKSRAEMVARAREVLHREARAIDALSDQLDESLADVVDMLLHCDGHVLVTGAGTSRAMAERFAHLLCCCGTPALFISAADSLHGSAGAITPKDVLFAISKGGSSSEVNQLVEIAHSRGAKVIAQTEDSEAELARMSDLVFRVKAVGNIDPYGMMALGSSLVNGAAGDALCVLLLELQGYPLTEFGRTHPGGAVGKMLSERGDI
jgi:D-arabinose 5-phosphate isomerase GutQ